MSQKIIIEILSRYKYVLIFALFLIAIIIAVGFSMQSEQINEPEKNIIQDESKSDNKAVEAPKMQNTLKNKMLYSPSFYQAYEQDLRNYGGAALRPKINSVLSQPMTIWLTGPSGSDPSASRDINSVSQTSKEAGIQGTVPVYQLYAIPNRDSCAGYSSGGHASSENYLAWIDSILDSLSSEAIFLVEADAIAQAISSECLSANQIQERYALLRSAVEKLSESANVIGVYLDAAHPAWFPDQNQLIEPLRLAGIDKATGVVINVSNFIETDLNVSWSKKLVELLGGDKKVIIDTSRNGNGSSSQNLPLEERWCNPSGRAVGPKPSTNTGYDHVEAFLWVKTIGQSDGQCRGYPPAGTFIPNLAVEMIRNSNYL